jgi:hypothetical protein
MRQAGTVQPILGAGPAPVVSSATGLGTGGGAFVQAEDGNGFGTIVCHIGAGAGAAPVLVLKYASAPPTMFYQHEDDLGSCVVTGQGTATHTLTFSGATLMKHAGKNVRIAYEWATSK